MIKPTRNYPPPPLPDNATIEQELGYANALAEYYQECALQSIKERELFNRLRFWTGFLLGTTLTLLLEKCL